MLMGWPAPARPKIKLVPHAQLPALRCATKTGDWRMPDAIAPQLAVVDTGGFSLARIRVSRIGGRDNICGKR